MQRRLREKRKVLFNRILLLLFSFCNILFELRMLGLRSNLFGRIISSNVRQEPFKKFTPFLFNVQPKNVITFTSPNQPIFSRFASHKKERQKEEKRQLRYFYRSDLYYP